MRAVREAPLEVSIVIPTLDAGSGFEALLEGIARQRGDFGVETIVVDSGSSDGTIKLARRYGAVVHQISCTEFNHGAARNLGISLSGGEYVALTVQDAVPADENWLASMVENLEEDEAVAGVYGRQVPSPEAGPLARSVVNGLATASCDRREQRIVDLEGYMNSSPAERRRLATFDDVSSCLRRSVWEEIPFERASFGEDLRWGKRVVESGYKLVYEPRSVVRHSHERGGLYELRRHYVDAVLLEELFGNGSSPGLGRTLLSIPSAAIHRYRLLRRETGRHSPRLVAQAARHTLLSRIGAYLGSERVFRGNLGLNCFLSRGV